MKTFLIPVGGLVLVCLLFVLPRQAAPQDASKGPTLKVKVNYSGAGTVDDKHKIFVVLWDSAAFMEGGEVMPVEMQTASSKDGVVTFADVKKSPAYVSSAFDPSGAWDGQSGPPPDGTSLGLYSKTPGKAEPIDIAPGKTVTVELPFDDSVKMEDGKPAMKGR